MFYIACCTLVLIHRLKYELRTFSFLSVGQYFLKKNKKNTTFTVTLFVLLKYILYICGAIMQ